MPLRWPFPSPPDPSLGAAPGAIGASARSLEVVEREDVEACEVRPFVVEALVEAFHERSRVESAAERPPEPALVRPEEAQRVTDADPCRHADELRERNGAGKPDMDRELRPSVPHRFHPGCGHACVEADLADDVGRELLLGEHRLDRRVVRDERVALRVAGNADIPKRLSELGKSSQQRE